MSGPGQREGQRRAGPQLALGPHGPSLSFDETLGDEEAQPSPLVRGPFGLPVPVEQATQMVGGDAWPGVVDGHSHVAAVGRRGDGDLTSFRSELEGVANDV